MSRVRLTTLFVLLAATGLVAACGRGPEQAKANDSETRVEPRSTPASSPFENSPPAVQLVAKGAADPINAPTTDKIEAKETLANWILEDPRNVPLAGQRPELHSVSGKPAKAQKGDSLLAILHGVGQQGWRDAEARQAFLLKNGVGKNMMIQSSHELQNDRSKTLPPLKGDAIRQTIGGKSGLVFWTGAKYAWYSLESH